ncbi:hypothetical protein A3K69_06030 [Candidatus Bathyarchaeota archaeon RBG_16_57_9]|nr:MAG: hypothetical protein A3K69_06030 [Candidatus Bathyarchaeota archaeon RBG_16_57_9]OGD53253.1 MAG: hypothetical protein A3K81_02295 [Candidatus Bathyarchaeota archaeon RBG_13_60_20]
MSAKTIGALLIGVILGGGSGFAYIYMVLGPQIVGLQGTVEGLQGDLSALDVEFDALMDEREELLTQLHALQSQYDGLSEGYETLVGEHDTLQERYQQLTSEYESLLSDYEAAFGGLPISPGSIPVIEKEYTWTWEGAERSVSVSVPEALYSYYSVKARYTTTDYRGYVLHPHDDGYVSVLAREFEVFRVEEGLTEPEVMGLAVSFVQSLEYVEESPSGGLGDYPKYPLETLADGGGDCEDTSILMASLLESMGYQVSLLLLPNHMAVGLAVDATGAHWTVDNVTYYYLETTTEGWDIGKVPAEFNHKATEVFPVGDAPYVYQSWSATRRNERVTLDVKSTNEGRLTAEGYRVWVALEDLDGNVRAEALSAPFNLAFKETRWSTLKLTGPRFETLRLVIGVMTPEGEVMDKLYSAYFTTR